MARHEVRSALTVVLLLSHGLASADGTAFTSDSSTVDETASTAGSADAGVPPRQFEGVWYRTPEKRGKILVFLAQGKLRLGAGTITFESEKIKLAVPTERVKGLNTMVLPEDPVQQVWVALEYEEEGAKRVALFKDGALGKATHEIRRALEATWVSGEPPPATVPGEQEVASAIAALHTNRVESLYYNNSTVPKDVWKLVFTPGIDDALLHAYQAADPDDLYRFNLIMILNRRVASIEDEEARARVHECMVQSLTNDPFEWVKVESLDGIRRLAQVDELSALGSVIEGRPAAEALALATWYAGTKGVPVLYLASHGGWNDVVGLLIEQGASVEETAGSAGPGWTPLMIAAAEGRAGTVTLLLDAGANPNATNDLGRTPLMFAAAHGFTPIVEDLLTRGANSNAVPNDETGWSALIAAADKGHAETVEALLKAGADPTIKDKAGKTALDHAKSAGHSKVVRLLKPT